MGRKVTYSPSSGDLLFPSIALVTSGRPMLFTLPDPIFIDNGSGRFETFPIYGIELWGAAGELISWSRRVIAWQRWTYTEEGIILFSPVIVTVCALYIMLSIKKLQGQTAIGVLTTSLKCWQKIASLISNVLGADAATSAMIVSREKRSGAESLRIGLNHQLGWWSEGRRVRGIRGVQSLYIIPRKVVDSECGAIEFHLWW